MGLDNDGVWYLPFKDANNQDDIYHTTSQQSNFGALYLPDHGPWIAQSMDITQPPPKGAPSSSAPNSESGLSSGRVKVALRSVRQRTAQACDKCRERKTKCSGHRPVCLRCTNRGLVCEYSTRLRSRFHPGYTRPTTDSEIQYSNQIAATRSLFCEPTMGFSSGAWEQGSTVAYNFDYSLYGLDQ